MTCDVVSVRLTDHLDTRVPATLRLTGTRTLDSGVVSLTYVPTGRD